MLVTSLSQLSVADGNNALAAAIAVVSLHSIVALSEAAVVDQVGAVVS
jgi:hypothetical protein